MLDIGAPPARRLSLPHWLNARLGLGLVLVLVATVVGAKVVGGADRTSPVWVARHAMPVGYVATPADFAPVPVRLAAAAPHYLSAGRPVPAGYVVGRALAAGELVPVDALVAPEAADPARRTVAVAVGSTHYPHELAVADLVDVYVTRKGSDGSEASSLLLSGVPVGAVPRGGGSVLGGSDRGVAVELDVPAGDVAGLVSAMESGQIDLVRVGVRRPGAVPGVTP